MQVVCYELRMLKVYPGLPRNDAEQWDTPFSNSENMEHFYTHLEETLVDLEFLDPAAPRQLMPLSQAEFTMTLGDNRYHGLNACGRTRTAGD